MTTKVCSNCYEVRQFNEFCKDSYKKSGLTSWCKPCMAEKARLRRLKYPSKSRAISRKYRYNNLDKERLRYTTYNKQNPCVRSYHSAKRRATAKGARLGGNRYDKSIKSMYFLAKRMENIFNTPYHVDHIVPLNGENICGLHVPWNLQLLPASINQTKGNRTDEKTAFRI